MINPSQIDESGNSKVVQATSVEYTYSVEDHGIFYIGRNQNRLMYYDFQTGENYVLCSSPNCKHKDASCPAYVGDMYRVYAYAYYQGNVYLLRKEKAESKTIDLICMKLGEQTQKVIASIDGGDSSAGTWTIESIQPVVFSKGHAFLELNYVKAIMNEEEYGLFGEIQGKQLMMISLEQGRKTEITDILEYEKDYEILCFCNVLENYAVYEKIKYEGSYLNAWDYIDQYGTEAYEKEYDQYKERYYAQTEARGESYAIDIDKETMVQVWNEPVEEETEGLLRSPNFIYEEEGVLYYRRYEEEKLILHGVDASNGQRTRDISFSDSINNLWYTEQNSLGGYTYEPGKILVACHDSENLDDFKLYKYSVSEDSLELIWDRYMNYDVWAMTDDYIILSNESAERISRIKKEDYEAQDFSKMTRIRLDW